MGTLTSFSCTVKKLKKVEITSNRNELFAKLVLNYWNKTKIL
ncbi:hypothetical protein LEP1GSC132_3765 [Leptospira kirschneri str. 200803703]|nr:hypothetical protein LEP1GSC018_0203 [Leptospira kirschneri str. 2008720114]EMO69119.1 hypothetical protein LEP1GSC132_3765 [Leptospira kirschneri str. 200803703]